MQALFTVSFSAPSASSAVRVLLCASFLSLTLIALLAGAAGQVYAAEDAAQKKAELEKLRGRIQQVSRQLQDDIGARDRLTRELRSAEKELARLNAELRDIDGEIGRKRDNLGVLRQEQAATERELGGEKTALADQIRAAYAAGREERLKLLLNQEDPVRLGRALVYYDYLNRARTLRIEIVREHLRKLAELTMAIGKELAGLNELRERRGATVARLEDTRRSRARVLADLEKSIRARGMELERLRSDEAALAQLVERLESVFADIPASLGAAGKFADLRGKLAWPARGSLLNRYGDKREDGRMRWQGVTIAAANGSQVQAVSHGRVAYADWLPHFGLLLIIEHGGGYMSLYGHNQSLYKEAGDWVEAGEPIASVGDSGGQNRSALYFEIRRNGKPVDPASWLTR